jgi:molybdopterin/thiamine biosynthesis adenylyltransferase
VADEGFRARLKLHDALVGRGFERRPNNPGTNYYEGQFAIGEDSVPIFLLAEDLDFVAYPIIGIMPGWRSDGRRLPHVLGPGGIICYYAAGAVVLDRYSPGGTILQCLNQAERVLRDALAGRLDADFADEFRSYWGGTWELSDLPLRYDGDGKFHTVRLAGDHRRMPVLSTGKSWLLDRPDSRPSPKGGEPVHIVTIDEPLTLNPFVSWPPANLSEVTDWLEWFDPRLLGELDAAIKLGTLGAGTLAIRAPNGTFSLRVQVPPRMQTTELLANRRKSLPRLLHGMAKEVKVERSTAVAADLDYIYGRNLGSMKGLAGKRILQIGCGTIGSFLAQQLAQSGAGTGGGRLKLVDEDVLQPSNLGRHLLGVPHLNQNKAIACADLLNTLLPGAEIDGVDKDALTLVDFDRFDLVIDATGEEVLSLALNARAISRRPNGPDHLFVWLLGNGTIAQAILVGDSNKACFKCLKPELAGQPRFRALRPDVDVEIGRIHACGDADFVPFPVSRPVAAAAMACDMVLDWANGVRGDRFRNTTFDAGKAFTIANSSPGPTPRCPACGTSH